MINEGIHIKIAQFLTMLMKDVDISFDFDENTILSTFLVSQFKAINCILSYATIINALVINH